LPPSTPQRTMINQALDHNRDCSTGLTAYASAHGVDLAPKAKPAC
jgi:hypothetical protein